MIGIVVLITAQTNFLYAQIDIFFVVVFHLDFFLLFICSVSLLIIVCVFARVPPFIFNDDYAISDFHLVREEEGREREKTTYVMSSTKTQTSQSASQEKEGGEKEKNRVPLPLLRTYRHKGKPSSNGNVVERQKNVLSIGKSETARACVKKKEEKMSTTGKTTTVVNPKE